MNLNVQVFFLLLVLSANAMASAKPKPEPSMMSDCVARLYSAAERSLIVRRTHGLLSEESVKHALSLKARRDFLMSSRQTNPLSQADRELLIENNIELLRIRPVVSTYENLLAAVKGCEELVEGMGAGYCRETKRSFVAHKDMIQILAAQLLSDLRYLEDSAPLAYARVQGALLLGDLLKTSKQSIASLAKQVGVKKADIDGFIDGSREIWSASLAIGLANSLQTSVPEFLAACGIPNNLTRLSEQLDSEMRKQGTTNTAVAKKLDVPLGFVKMLRHFRTDEKRYLDFYAGAFSFLGLDVSIPRLSKFEQASEEALLLGSAQLSYHVQEASYSVVTLAKNLGIERNRLELILEGSKWPMLSEIHDICTALNISSKQILEAYGYPAEAFESIDAYTNAVVLESARRSK